MIKERFQELVDFAKTESPNRLATKGWINEDIYLKLGATSDKENNKQELANLSLFWSPINKLISSLFLVISIASIMVFFLVSFSSGKLHLEISNSLFLQDSSGKVSLDNKDITLKQNREEVIFDSTNNLSVNKDDTLEKSLPQKNTKVVIEKDSENTSNQATASIPSEKKAIKNKMTFSKGKSNFF